MDALHTSEARFQLAMEASRDGIWDWDLTTDEVWYSSGYASMLGYAPGELPGHVRSWTDLIHPDDKDAALRANADCIENRCNDFETEFRMRDRGGRWLWVLGRGNAVSRDASGRATRMVGTHTDITARKLTEQRLRESEERYRFLTSVAQEGIFLSVNGVCTDANETAQRMFGFTLKECRGRHGSDFIASSERERVRHCMLMPDAPPYETRGLRRDGSEFPVRITSRNIQFKDKVVRVTVIRDISLERATQRSLLQSERRFRELTNSLPVRIVQLDTEFRYVSVNSRLEELTHFPASQCIGMTVSEVVPKEIWDIDRPKLEAALTGEKVHFEYDIVNADGKPMRLYAHYLPQRDEKGRITGIYCWTQDITPQIEAESRYRAMFETVGSGVAVYAPADPECTDFVFRDFNPAAERITGMSRKQVLGGRLLELFPGIEKIGLLKGLRRALKTGHSQYLPPAHVRFENRQGWRENIICPLPSGEVVAIFSDVTERVLLEQKLIRAKEAAEEASRMKSEFLANMSHEIRTPLNGIMGMLQLMNMTELNQEQQQYVDNALHSSNRLTDLLSDILDISVVESGTLILNAKPFSPLELLCSVEHLFGMLTREAGLKLAVRTGPGVPNSLVGDEQRLRQVLFNLVGNACKFTHNGAVTLDVHRLSSDSPDCCRLLLTVADTGIGIADETLGRLFTPFTQGSEGYARSYQGAGLGLSICKRLVTLMGGTMAVESAEGEGTAVHVCIPFDLDESRS